MTFDVTDEEGAGGRETQKIPPFSTMCGDHFWAWSPGLL